MKSITLVATLGAAALTAGTTGAAIKHDASSCPGAHTSARHGHASAHRIRAAVVCEINTQRAAFGLPPMTENGKLDHSAQRWAKTMVATGNFSHGHSPGARMRAAGFKPRLSGETIASGYDTPKQVVRAWLAETVHCQLLLSPTFTSAGIGFVPKAIGGAIGGATWVGDLALHSGQRPPSHKSAPARGCPYTR